MSKQPLDIEAERVIYEHFKRLGCFDPAKETSELIEVLRPKLCDEVEALRAELERTEKSALKYSTRLDKAVDLADTQRKELESLRERGKELEASTNNWMEQARQFCNNMEYYRGLLDKCAPYLGDAVYTQDDGNRSDSILRAKIPDLVAAIFSPIPPPVEPTKGDEV
jgi:hypothetical protein